MVSQREKKVGTPWKERILKRDFSIVLGKMLQSEQKNDTETEEFYLRSANVKWDGVDLSDVKTMWFSPDEKRDLLLLKGDLLVNEGGDVGRCAIWPGGQDSFYIQNAINRVRARSASSTKFLYYWLNNLKQAGFIDATVSRITIAHLTAEKLARIPVPDVPPKEQQLIVDYLDASCAAIDSAIGCKSKQIESLKELRAAWFHKIFSNKSWPQERIKDIVLKIGSGVTPDGGAANYLDHGIPLIRSQNVTFEGLKLDDVAYISEDTHKLMSNSQLKPCDVLLNITGASIGRCTYVPEEFGEANVNQHVCVIRCNHKIDYRFLAAFLQSPVGQNQVFSSFTGASRQGLSHKELGLMTIPLPEIEIQVKVVEEFDKKLLSHKQIQSCIEKQIATLLAYRRSLIHECVTGQRRVTEADMKKVREYGW